MLLWPRWWQRARRGQRMPKLTVDALRKIAPQIVRAVKYDHSRERAADILAACDELIASIAMQNGEAKSERAKFATLLARRVDDAKVLMRTTDPAAALAIMFDIGRIAQHLQLHVGIPDNQRTTAMSLTEAAKRWGYATGKRDADAGRKQMERAIKSGVIRAVKATDRKWWFDKRQMPSS